MEKILSCTVRRQNTSILLISGAVLISHYILFKFMMQLNSQYNLLEVTSPAIQIEFFQQSAKPEEKIPQQAKKIKLATYKPMVTAVKQVQEVKKEQPLIEKVIKNVEQKPILTIKQSANTNYVIKEQTSSLPPLVQKTVKVEESLDIKPETILKPVANNDIESKSDKLTNANSGKNTSTDIKDSSPKVGASSNSQYMGGKPRYPEYAEENGIEGTVTLNVLVGTDGKAKKIILNKSSGESILDNAAIKHVQSIGNKFKPMVKDGNSVEAWITFAIKFKLD